MDYSGTSDHGPASGRFTAGAFGRRMYQAMNSRTTAARVFPWLLAASSKGSHSSSGMRIWRGGVCAGFSRFADMQPP